MIINKINNKNTSQFNTKNTPWTNKSSLYISFKFELKQTCSVSTTETHAYNTVYKPLSLSSVPA